MWGKKQDSKKDLFKSEDVKKASEDKQKELNPSNSSLDKIKDYIDNDLHHVGTESFDKFFALYPDRQFFMNQHYKKDVVDVINEYV